MAADWVGATAERIAAAVGRSDVPATRVVADHLEHARLADRIVAALRQLRDAGAIAEAELVDQLPDLSPLLLAGVPVLVGEDTPVAGLPAWPPSSQPHRGVADPPRLAGADHEVVRRLRGAGAVIVGVSRVSELGLWAATDDPSAITRNPWRGDLGAGGAAGGAAAAVASGIVPLAHAVDGLGSLRVPAACCGVVGLKPDRELIGFAPPGWFDLAQHGVLATTVADALLGFTVLAGRPAMRWPEPGRVRVAVSTRSPLRGVSADADARAAVAQAARCLVRAGYDAVAADPPYPRRLPLLLSTIWPAVAYQVSEGLSVSAGLSVSGKPGDRALADLQPRTRRQVALGAQVTRRRLVRDGERDDWRRRYLDWLADRGFDALLLPTLPGSPPPARYWSERSWRANAGLSVRLSAFTTPWNLAGVPALTVPAGLRQDGLPGSVQLVGGPGSEALLLSLAASVERLLPWRRHAPGWPRDVAAHLRERTAAFPLVGFRSR